MIALAEPPDDKAVFLAAANEAGKEIERSGDSVHRIVAGHAANLR